MSGLESAWVERYVRDKINNSLTSPKAPNFGPEYWKKLLIGGLPFPVLDKIFLNLRRFFCYCLYGAPGAGQRNLAMAFAGDCQKLGYKVYDIPGQLLRGESIESTDQRVWEVFETVRKEPSVLIIENPGTPQAMECIRMACERVDIHFPLKVIVLEEKESILNAGLKSVFFMCRFELPNEEERTQFFEKMLRLTADDEPTPSGMASETGKFSYDDLMQLLNLIRLQLKAEGVRWYRREKKNQASEEEIMETIMDLRQNGTIKITMDLFEDSLVMIRQQKLAKGEKENVPSMKVIMEGGIPVAAGAFPGMVPVGQIPAVKTATDEKSVEEMATNIVNEDFEKIYNKYNGE